MPARASSFNYRDLMVVNGGGRGPTKLSIVPLSDGADEEETFVAADIGGFDRPLA